MDHPFVFVEPTEEVLGYCPLLCEEHWDDAVKFVEKFGRIAYKSEDRITADSAPKFVGTMVKKKHMSVTEASNLVVSFEPQSNHFVCSPFIKRDYFDGRMYYSGSMRAWMDYFGSYNLSLGFLDLVKEQVDWLAKDGTVRIESDNMAIPKSLRRFCVWFRNDRAFTHELVRHRVMSFLQESQRYVKYDTGIEMIKPQWFKGDFDKIMQTFDDIKTIDDWDVVSDMDVDDRNEYAFCYSLAVSATMYMALRNNGMHQQLSRGVLPNATKTEIYTMGYHDGWTNVRTLRSGSGAHPDMRRCMARLEENPTWVQYMDGKD